MVWHTLNKEERNSHLIPFPRFMVRASPYAHHVPQHILVKKKKKITSKPRLIWDGKNKRWAWEVTMNEMTDQTLEAIIMFGYVYKDYCTWIYNMRITYPQVEILLAFIDISSCFRWPRIFPDLVGAFGFVIGPLFFAANVMVFDSVASASSWEPFRVAISAMATAYFYRAELVARHAALLDLIQWDEPAPDDTVFVQAVSCSKNQGIREKDGSIKPSQHHIYVDDDLMADIRPRMPATLVSAVEAIFEIMGRPCLSLRQSAVAMDKWRLLQVAHVQILLGLVFNSRDMSVSITDDYREEVLDLLTTTWHPGRGGFTVSEMETLLGKLGRIGQAYRPIFHLMPHMFSSVAFGLRMNEEFLGSTASFRKLMKRAKAKPLPDLVEDEREINFAIRQVAQKKHRCDEKHFMPPSLTKEIAYMTRVLQDNDIKLSTPLAHIVDRDPTWQAWADACKRSGGGWSTDLLFWWHLVFPQDIVDRAYLPNNKSGLLISINVLEMICVIINMAASIYFAWLDNHDMSTFPILANWCDNKAAHYWVETRCKSSLLGREMGRLFCGLLMGTNLGIQSDWISTKHNVTADDISRLTSANGEYDYSQLIVDHPHLASCRQFQPSDTLLTMIWDALRNNGSPDPLIVRKLSPETLGSIIS